MPLVSLDHISMAYGHLPLLDDASLLVDAGADLDRGSPTGREAAAMFGTGHLLGDTPGT